MPILDLQMITYQNKHSSWKLAHFLGKVLLSQTEFDPYF